MCCLNSVAYFPETTTANIVINVLLDNFLDTLTHTHTPLHLLFLFLKAHNICIALQTVFSFDTLEAVFHIRTCKFIVFILIGAGLFPKCIYVFSFCDLLSEKKV